MKIDKRRKYHMVVDVETAGQFGNSLVYDIGYAIADKQGNIYETRSFIIKEIFYNVELMSSAYYARKIPMYLKEIEEEKRIVVSFLEMREDFLSLCEKYDTKILSAYNLMFDIGALSNTMKNITKNENAKFLNNNTKKMEMMCIWCLACETLYIQKTFRYMAIENNWLTGANNFKTSAEIGYRYITGKFDFEESHTGLEDVLIEVKIMAYAYRQNKKRIGGVFAHPWRIPNKNK